MDEISGNALLKENLLKSFKGKKNPAKLYTVYLSQLQCRMKWLDFM
jgi:hypothetical protein